jgi:hypothetical protein
MESCEVKQRTNMKFCFKLGETVRDTNEILVKVYGDVAMGQKMVFKLFECFCGGAELTEDEQRSDHPSTSTTDEIMLKINEMIQANTRLMIREVSNAYHFIWLSATRIDEKFEHETSEGKICSTPFVTRTENSSC